MKNIFDRYIIQELIGPFLFGMAAFSCILAGSTLLFPLIGQAVKFNIAPIYIFQLFIYKLPSIIVFTFPMSMLLATIMGIGRLSSDLEIIAFRASGIGIYRIVAPIIIAGFLVSVTTIWFNEVVVPRATSSGENLLATLVQQNKPKIQKNINLTQYDDAGYPQRIINVVKVEKNKLNDVTVAEFDKGRLSRVIRSDGGKFIPPNHWEFYDGVMHNFPQGHKDRLLVLDFKTESINLALNPSDLTKREKSVDELSAKELKNRIAFKEKTGQDSSEDKVRFHMKFAIPFASLIFAILGASIGLKPHRSSSTIGFGLSLLIIVIYYLLISGGMYLGLAHLVTPLISAWIPNILTGVAGLFLLQRLTTS